MQICDSRRENDTEIVRYTFFDITVDNSDNNYLSIRKYWELKHMPSYVEWKSVSENRIFVLLMETEYEIDNTSVISNVKGVLSVKSKRVITKIGMEEVYGIKRD